MARKFLTPIDLAGNELRNAAVQNLAADPGTPVKGQIYFNTTSNVFKYYDGTAWQVIGTGTGTGSVTTASVVNANGFAGSVANPTTTPAITISTTVSGLLKGNGTSVSAATAGSDYLAPSGNGSALTGLTQSQVSGLATALGLLAPLASPAFSGSPTTTTPTSSSGVANKSYVDSVAQGLSVKPSAAAATAGAETFTIATGTVTQIAGTTVDGVSPNVNDYVLVKDAPSSSGTGSPGSSQPGNGLYQVTSNVTNLALARAASMTGSNGPAGAYVFVSGGTVNADNGYVVSVPSTNAGFAYGGNAIQWEQFSGAGQITASTGLAKSGNTLSIENGGVLLPAHGGTGGASVAAAKASLGFGSVFNSAAIGGATPLTVTHNLNNAVPIVQVYDVSGPNPVQVICDVTATSANAVQLDFGTAPASGSIKVAVLG